MSKADAGIGHPDAGIGHPDAEPVESEPDAAPAEPCSTQTINLLTNGNLDGGQGGGWLETSSGDYPLIINQSETQGDVNAQSGQFMAWLGGYADAVDTLTQEVSIPADATNVRVRGHRLFITDEDGGVFDRTWIDITDTAGTQLELLKEWSNQDSNSGWAAFNFAVGGDYQGDVIRLRLRSDADDTLRTHFFYDSLLLEVTTCQ